MRSITVFWLTLWLLMSALVQAETDWPQFRGSGGQGHADSHDLPLHWSETEGIVWKSPIVGRGWSSPVVLQGSIWLTTAIEQHASEQQREEFLANSLAGTSPMAGALNVAASVSLRAVEVDLKTGEVLREIELFQLDSSAGIHQLNSYASPTPVIEQGRLYCHFGTFGTACLDTTTGETLWHRQFRLEHMVGPGSSPVVCGNLVVLTCDGADQQYIVAVDKHSGETAWRTDRPPIRASEGDFRKAFSTPLLIEATGREQLVIPGAQWFVAYDPASGEELWRVDHGRGFSNVPRPVFDGQLVYLCTGFASDKLLAVRPDGSGDVSATHVAWHKSGQIPHMSSPLLVDQRIYLISDSGVASCLDTTGQRIWRDRIAGKYSASPLYADGKIYVCSHAGRTTVFAPGDQYQQLAENDLDGAIMASPAVADGDLLLRTDTHLYRIGR